MSAPERPIVVVKLGGSVITRKRGPPRARPKVLARLASELSGEGLPPIVLLHGAGSFGHPGAARFALHEPPRPGRERERLRGAAIVSAEVRRLHGLLLAALLDAGARPWSLPAGALALNEAGRLRSLEAGPFDRALSAGLLPVSFGDVVPDSAWGFSILSADAIALALARSLPVGRVLFVGDVDGIFRRFRPAKGRPELIARIDRAMLADWEAAPGAVDVTGGIRAKAEAMVALAEGGTDAGLISGLRHGALARAVRGELEYGSWSRPETA